MLFRVYAQLSSLATKQRIHQYVRLLRTHYHQANHVQAPKGVQRLFARLHAPACTPTKWCGPRHAARSRVKGVQVRTSALPHTHTMLLSLLHIE